MRHHTDISASSAPAAKAKVLRERSPQAAEVGDAPGRRPGPGDG